MFNANDLLDDHSRNRLTLLHLSSLLYPVRVGALDDALLGHLGQDPKQLGRLFVLSLGPLDSRLAKSLDKIDGSIEADGLPITLWHFRGARR